LVPVTEYVTWRGPAGVVVVVVVTGTGVVVVTGGGASEVAGGGGGGGGDGDSVIVTVCGGDRRNDRGDTDHPGPARRGRLLDEFGRLGGVVVVEARLGRHVRGAVELLGLRRGVGL
jgi:hypothetical protein